ncbi:AI-2E family transporter [Leptolyngbya sp. FACHB-541]|uniref:AI-2E family transporter n=1 Tax=Leptolyngbya sp. FACHB-541 TaxID=2692810 RepID=UPI0016857A77|nr:AI-2E family transporter [Leptolyngbya sp. FACHB-541]MBD1995729.1 AI-2E family transporter [Leptolyngbya sp. FACHB-541]
MVEPSAKSLWERLNNLTLVRLLLLFASGWAIVQFLSYFETVVVIFTSATILAFLLSYPTRWLSRMVPHGAAVILIFLISMMIIGAASITIGLGILSQGQRLAESVTEFLNSLAPVVGQVEELLQSRNLQVDLEGIEEQLRTQALSGIGSGLSLIQIFFANLINLILIAVVSFFMLLDGERLWNFVLKVFPSHLRRRLTVTLQRNLLGFFWGRLLLCFFYIGSAFVVFLILKVPFPLVLAFIAGVFNLIPGIGATLGISLISLILLSQSVWLAFKVLVVCIIIEQIEENLLLPRIMQNSLDINPVVMFFALLVGARVAGIFGLFLAVPVAGVVVSLLEIEEMRGRSQVSLPRDLPLEEK